MRLRFRAAVVITCTLLAVTDGCKPNKGEDTGGSTGASTSSSGENSVTGSPDGCGDGTLLTPEACDDGNHIDGDGCNSDCQISGSLVWCTAELGDDGPGVSGGNSVAIDGEGNAIVVGMAFSAKAQGPEAIVAKYTPAGELTWTRILSGASAGEGVVIRADDTIVVGTSAPLLFHLDPSSLIKQVVPLPDTFALDKNSLTQASSGVIAFAANMVTADPRGVIGVLNDDLSLAWTQVVDDQDAKTEAHAIAPDFDGNWLLGGHVVVETIDMGDAGTWEIPGGFVRKYDRNGGLIWTQPVLSTDDSLGIIITAIQAADANEAVALGIYTANTALSAPNMLLVSINADGKLNEQLTLDNSDLAMYGRDLLLAPNGDRIATGTLWPGDPEIPAYAFIRRYSASGSLQWSFRNGLMPTSSSGFTGLSYDATGDLFATGVQRGTDAGQDRVLLCRIRR